MKIVDTIKKYMIPKVLKRSIRSLIFRRQYKCAQINHALALKIVRKKPTIKVAFFLIHESVWKCDEIYKLMVDDERFEPIVVVCPYVIYGEEVMLRDLNQAYSSFSKRGIMVVKSLDDQTGGWLDVKKDINPDVVFFTNPWNLTRPEYCIENYLDRLTCYVPYGFKNSYLYEAHFNKPMQNLVWKFFVETPIHKALAQKYSRNNAANVVVTGFPGMDRLLSYDKSEFNPWKIKGDKHKRVIWAPHHTIPEYGATLDYSTFLSYADIMLKIVDKFKDTVQFAFKPHPLLRAKLSLNDVWGEDRTNEYFSRWEKLENGALIEGDYISLFQSSDALLNDSSSFVIEYLYTEKPMLFLLENEIVLDRFNEVGMKSIGLSYIARKPIEVEAFITDVVLESKDPFKSQRREFFESVVRPPHNRSASENIVTYLKNELASC